MSELKQRARELDEKWAEIFREQMRWRWGWN